MGIQSTSRELLDKARNFAKKELSFDSGGHDWWHAQRVARTAVKIAEVEGADADFCELIALLHDIPDDKRGITEEEGLELLTQWMKSQRVPIVQIEEVLEILRKLSFRGGTNPPMDTIEGKVVQDADRLDALGAIGIARTFAYSGKKGQVIYDPGLPIRDTMTLEEYRTGESTALNHFYEKLFKLSDLMNTSYAKSIARKRVSFMEAYLEEFMKEWDF